MEKGEEARGRVRGEERVGVFPFAVALKIDKRNCCYIDAVAAITRT